MPRAHEQWCPWSCKLLDGYNQGSDCEIARAGKLHEGKEIMQLNPSMVTFAAQVNRPPINKSSVLTITEVNIVILTTN